MLQFLPIIGKAIGLFDAAKTVYEEIAGKPSTSTDPSGLAEEVRLLPAEKQALFIERLRAETDQFRAETERFFAEHGLITPELLGQLTPEQAGRVAYLRMTTRPWVVRMMARAIFWPPMFVLANDGVTTIVNNWSSALGYAFSVDLLAVTILDPSAGFLEIYSWLAPSAVAIVTSWFTLREIGKTKTPDTPGAAIGQVVDRATGLWDTIKRTF